jgi:GTP cyclohydrolase I
MSKPTKQEALNAVALLLEYIGVDTNSEHFCNTPTRVVNSYDEIYGGYKSSLAEIFDAKTYSNAEFKDMILMKNISFHSVCAHHMLPISGHVSIAYIPGNKIIGISKLARLVNVFAKRLQIQEAMTVQIASSLQESIDPLGVAIKINASHYCMMMRGVEQNNNLSLDTYHFTGIFKEDKERRNDFLNNLKG